jgi:hypothetical protein
VHAAGAAALDRVDGPPQTPADRAPEHAIEHDLQGGHQH